MTTMWTEPLMSSSIDDEGLLQKHAHRSQAALVALNRAQEILAVSDFVKSVFVRHGIAAHRIRTLPPALSLTGITWRHRHVAGEQVRFGFLGRLTPLKGAHVFAEASRDLPRERARFLMFGPGDTSTRSYLQQQAGDDRIEFRGEYTRAALASVLDELDVVVVPSIAQETVGLVSLEAQAAGIPVIVSDAGALPEFVRDGGGTTFRSGDANDLRQKMMSIILDPASIARMSVHTRPALSLQTHLANLIEIYANVQKKSTLNESSPTSSIRDGSNSYDSSKETAQIEQRAGDVL